MGLRGPVGRVEQADLALRLGQGEHAVVDQRGGELLGGDAVDLMAAVGDEVEHEAGVADLLRERPHLVVAHTGRVPVERGRQVVGEHLVGELGVDRLGELLCLVRGRPVAVSIQIMSAYGATESDLRIAYSRPPRTW